MKNVWVALAACFLVSCSAMETLDNPAPMDVSQDVSEEITSTVEPMVFGDGTGYDVMLQAFHWEAHQGGNWWNTILAEADDIKADGFSMVWFPPASEAASDEGYLPGKLYNLTSKYGTQAQLTAAITKLRDLKAIADIVINHRCGNYQINGKWHGYNSPDWGSWAVVCNNTGQDSGTGGWDTGEDCGYAPDIDHNNAQVRTDIKAWLNWMKTTVGFDGWRYDMVVGYSGSFVGEYNTATSPIFSVGEDWNYDRQTIINWIDATGGKSTAFDFPTRNLLLNAVNNGQYYNLKDGSGKPGGLIGWWPQKAVTFIENHDTEEARNGAYTAPFPADKTMQGYAYILTHPGVPCVFWLDWVQYRTEIAKLINIRRSQGITSSATVSISVADSSKYAAIINGKVAVKIGYGDWNPGTGWTLAASGNNYAVWTKSANDPTPTTLRTVVFMYKETVPGQDIFIKGGHDAGLVPSVYKSMAEPIAYNNIKNTTTAAIKANDVSLDWTTESALDWTCNAWPSSWGAKKTYAADGYGEDPENTMGLHWWKFDVKMSGTKGEWFEFKAFMRQGSTEWWENDRVQAGTPSKTINHWGKKGYITKTRYNENWVEFTSL